MEKIANIARAKTNGSFSNNVAFVNFEYSAQNLFTADGKNPQPCFENFSINQLLGEFLGSDADFSSYNAQNFSFMGTGWQSWDAGWEVQPGEAYPKYRRALIPAFAKYIDVPCTPKEKYSPDFLQGKFIIYLRWGSRYLVIASAGKNTAPVRYTINRADSSINCFVYAKNKTYQPCETVAKLCVFFAPNFFALKQCIFELFHDSRFDDLSFLGERCGGWESWYNHYNKIDQNLILEDLEALGKTENFIKLSYIDQNKPVVFQIDDGWQQATGQWEINTERFPDGLKSVTDKIRAKGYVPGLWIAPFICDYRADFVQQHKDWLLRDKKGKPVPAGFNFAWGARGGKYQPAKAFNYFCWDLSKPEVIDFIDGLMEKLVNQWGFGYIKLDFLFAGMLDGAFTSGGAAFEHYKKAMEVLTRRKIAKDGSRVAYLGCGMPFEASYQYLPLSRIGTDTKEHWDSKDMKMLDFCGRPSAWINMKDTLGHAFWNGAVFCNDPDVIFVREENCSLNIEEKLTIALVNYIFAGQMMYSDDPAKFAGGGEAELNKKIVELYKNLEGVEFGLRNIEKDVYIIFSKDANYCGCINLSDAEFPVSSGDLRAIMAEELDKNFAENNFELVHGSAGVFEAVDGDTFIVPAHATTIFSVR